MESAYMQMSERPWRDFGGPNIQISTTLRNKIQLNQNKFFKIIFIFQNLFPKLF